MGQTHRSFLRILLSSVLLAGASGLLAMANKQSPPLTVANVDVDRYTGKWYEIAAIPMYFERKCVANATAEYTKRTTGELSVFNSCEMSNGKRQSAVGQARVTDPPANSKLEVSFLNLPMLGWQYWAAGDYWILDLAADYSTVIVGHPSYKYGWILARNQRLPINTLKELTQKLKTLGYNPCDFITMPQTSGITSKQPLCVTASGSEAEQPATTP